MKISATTNQLGLAPMRIPKTRASWIDPVRIHTHGGRRAQGGAPRADSLAMRLLPPPHASAPQRASLGQARPQLRRDSRADRRDHRGRRRQRQRPRERAQPCDQGSGSARHRRSAGRGGLRRPPLRPDVDGAHRRQDARGRDGRPRCRKPGRRCPGQDRPRRRLGEARGRGHRRHQDVERPRRQALRRRQARRHRLRGADRRRLRGRRGRQRDHRHRALHHAGQPRSRAGR